MRSLKRPFKKKTKNLRQTNRQRGVVIEWLPTADSIMGVDITSSKRIAVRDGNLGGWENVNGADGLYIKVRGLEVFSCRR